MTITDTELENELARRNLEEQMLLAEPQESSIKVVTEAVGPLLFNVCIEGMPVSAVVDSGAQSTVLS